MQVLIVDDEPLAQDILESYIRKIPSLSLAGMCNNALEAFSLLNTTPVDLMLLDINMPEISGLDFLKMLKAPPPVIFTTAYSEFAVLSYELDATDYLVKPIPFDRFLKAIQKVQERKTQAAPATTTGNEVPVLFVRTEGKLVKIDLEKLWLIEALKDYVRLWTEHGNIVVHSTMKNIEEQLAARPGFIRVSKSYIVNFRYITEVDGNIIRIKNQIITIGNTYRDTVHEVFNNYRLL